MSSMSSVSAGVGSGSVMFTSVVTLTSGSDRAALFGPSALAGASVPSGLSTLTIKYGSGATKQSAVLQIADVSTGSVSRSNVVDFAGLTYCSMQPFTKETGLVMALPSMNGVSEKMTLFRDSTEGSGTYGWWYFSSTVVDLPYTITVNVQSDISIPTGTSQGNFYRVLETVQPGVSPDVWSSTLFERPLDTVIRGNSVVTPESGPSAVTISVDNPGFIHLNLGYYRIQWRVPGFGVDKFQSWLEKMTGTCVFDNVLADAEDVVLGSPAFSASTSSSCVGYSVGEVTISVTSAAGADFALRAVAQSTNPVQGRGNLNNANSDAILPASGSAFVGVVRDILSEVSIQTLIA